MTIKVDVTAFGTTENILRKLQGRGEKTPSQALATLALKIRATAVDLVQKGPKTGITYGNHQASSPGESPATDTGNLVNSIKVKKGDKDTWFVVAGAGYASYLEFGTERMEARPFMTPAFVEAVPSLKDEIWKAYKEQQDLLKGD